MVFRLKRFALIVVAVFVLGGQFPCQAYADPGLEKCPGDPAPEYRAVYLLQDYLGPLPGDNQHRDLDDPGDDDSPKKRTDHRRGRGRGNEHSCGNEDYRRIDLLRPCGKAWAG